MEDGPARAVGKEGHEGGRADRAAVVEGEGEGAVGVEPDPLRVAGDGPGFSEDAPGMGTFWAAYPFSVSVWSPGSPRAVLLSPWHPIRLAWLAAVSAGVGSEANRLSVDHEKRVEQLS